MVQIDWQTGGVMLLGETGACLLGQPAMRPAMRLFTDGRTFARAWAGNRLAYVNRHRAGRVPGLMMRDPTNAALPGFLVAGQLDAVTRWEPLLGASTVVIDNPANARTLERLLTRAAGVPTVQADANLKVAA